MGLVEECARMMDDEIMFDMCFGFIGKPGGDE
jgi:hypothetical protein